MSGEAKLKMVKIPEPTPDQREYLAKMLNAPKPDLSTIIIHGRRAPRLPEQGR
jgi:hypothetical protein